MRKKIKLGLLSLKKKAPKVPDYTCNEIDTVITTLDSIQSGEKKFNIVRLSVLKKKLERLRSSNDALRDSGTYWYGICKEMIENLKTVKKKL